MKAKDALEHVITVGYLAQMKHQQKPGFVIERAGAEVREALQDLTSKDAADTRYPKP